MVDCNWYFGKLSGVGNKDVLFDFLLNFYIKEMETQILIRGEGKTQHSMYLTFRILLAGENLKIDFAGWKN